MLLTLLSPLLGILSSLLPSLVRIFEVKINQKFQLEMAKLQMEAAVQNGQISLAIEDAKADISDAESVRSFDSNVDGGRFINALRVSIRPVITYVFFMTFIAVKVTVIYVMVQQGASMTEMIKAVWDQDTMALFGAVMGFWFGTRMLKAAGYGGSSSGKIITVKSISPDASVKKNKD